ncbi:hypothetical protein CJP46_11215 [Paenibacillus sp. XY044]|nr:hypothetical protein CJP46_11215 [Paenibacillus sp. XY044]
MLPSVCAVVRILHAAVPRIIGLTPKYRRVFTKRQPVTTTMAPLPDAAEFPRIPFVMNSIHGNN